MYNVDNHFEIIAPILKIAVRVVCYTVLIYVAFIIEQLQKVTTISSSILCARKDSLTSTYIMAIISTNRRELCSFSATIHRHSKRF